MRRAVIAVLLLVGLLVASPLPATEAEEATEGGGVPLTVQVVQQGLSIPWGLDFAPDGTMYFTERGGGWWSVPPPYTGTRTPVQYNDDNLYVNGETGLLDLELDPDFATNRRVFTCQGMQPPGAHPRIQVISWRMFANNARVRKLRVVVNDITVWGQRGRHGGCRLLFDGSGNLYIGTGDGASANNPQNLRTLGGKILRVDPDTGAGLPTNPWGGNPNANRRRIWNYGHRNIQGLALRPGTVAQIYSLEHGTDRDDELNRVFKGRNYGWLPGPGYDESRPMTDHTRFRNPVDAIWSSGFPTVATSGADFIDDPDWGAWNGALAVGCLVGERLLIFPVSGGAIQDTPVLPPELNNSAFGRLRTLVMGPDGALYITTAEGSNDKILRVTPT
jgi:glucose/arabinose dehydrogenase